MTTSDMIRVLCEKMNISISELARRIGQSPQNFNKKLQRGTMSFKELMTIAIDVKYEQAFILSNRNNEQKQLNMNPVKYFYSCPVCGKYEYYISFAELTGFNLNHLGSYLVYNGFKESFGEYRYFSTMSKE